MTKFFEAARQVVIDTVADLGPDEDFMPRALIRTIKDELVSITISMPESDNGRDELKWVVMAQIVMHGGLEAVFASCAWAVMGASCDAIGSTMPSQHPDRREVVILAHATRVSKRAAISELTRHRWAAPTMGAWEEFDAEGRFVHMLEQGLLLARDAPPELRRLVETAEELGQWEAAATGVTNAIRRLATGS